MQPLGRRGDRRRLPTTLGDRRGGIEPGQSLAHSAGGAVDGPRGPDSPPPATSPEPVDAPHSDDSGDDHPDDMSWIEEVVNAA